MARTRRRRDAFHAVAAMLLCLQSAAMAWNNPAVTIKTRQVQLSGGSKLNFEQRGHHMRCSLLRIPLLLHLTSTPLRRHRVSVVGQTSLQSGGLQELENLRAAAASGAQQQTDTKTSTKSSRPGGGSGGGRGAASKRKLQSVDFTTALVMSRELAQTVVPSRVENAYQLDPYNLAIGLRTLEGNMWLHVCWHPQGARCHVGAPPPREKEQKAYTFSQTLRSLIRGLNIVKVGLARPFERVVTLDLSTRLDEPPSYRIYVEIMASRSNVVLVAVDADGAETVAACAYQISPNKSVRPLSTGQSYELPPVLVARRPTLEESLEDFTEGVGRVPTVQLKKALVGVYQGTSPALVNTMASCVPDLSPSVKVGELTPEQWNALYSGPWKRWLELVGDGTTTTAAADSGSTSPPVSSTREGSSISPQATTAWLSKDGLSYYPTKLGGSGTGSGGGSAGEGREEDEASGFSSTALQRVMERYYRGTQSTEEFDELKRRCVARISATLAKLREREVEFERQVAAAQDDQVAELNRRGDLLVTYGHAWVQGETHVKCVDFDTGENIDIQISADKTPVEEAQQAFKQGKKLKRSMVVVRELLDQVKTQILYAEGIEMALEQLRGGGSTTIPAPTSTTAYESGTAAAATASREELSVLRGISEELGLQGDRESTRKFAGVFGVKQAQVSNRGGGGGSGRMVGGNRRKGKSKGGTSKAGGSSSSSSSSSSSNNNSGKESLVGLLELRRPAPGSPAVLVGRNNLQNDRITFSVARAHELWFHARGVAGAHVLLRLEPGQAGEDEDVQFAADIAVYFSKARQSASTPVDFISPKAVKKVGGGGPGMVKYDGAKVVRGEPSRVESAVKEVLRRREETAR